ncbi:MAG: AAA family ATPase [Deltaproteobacteria bacterium]|nr:AAA family ATPase [Deltaproteobacteria bacterium]
MNQAALAHIGSLFEVCFLNLKELESLVKKGESDRLEFKRSTGQRTRAAKTVCAMLNGLGGFVFFGVTDQGKIVGQEVSAKTLEDIAHEIREIEPPAFPDTETVALPSGKAVIVLHIPGSGGLYACKGRSYIRNGPTTIPMPRTEYGRRLMEKLHSTRRWENEPVAEGVTVRDLDQEEIQITLDNAIRLGRLEPTGRRDTESILLGLELIREGHLLNAAVALYGKSDPLKTLYPQMGIRLGRFRGKDRLADFVDNRQYWGHAFSLLRRGESFLMDHVPIAGRVIPGKMVREDQPAYPPRATREALANALCHRDYTIPGGAVAVAMYNDHLEITNPGALHFGITPEKLAKPHESRPWNPIIANVFYRAGIIERWGSGTLNIMDWCMENGNPAPAWKEQADSVYVLFLPAELPPSEQSGTRPRPDIDPVAKEVRDQVGTKSEPSRDQVEILRNCLNEKGILELMAIAGRTSRTKFRNQVLKPLLDAGVIEMTIPEKPRSSKQRYRLTAKGKEWLAKYQGEREP